MKTNAYAILLVILALSGSSVADEEFDPWTIYDTLDLRIYEDRDLPALNTLRGDEIKPWRVNHRGRINEGLSVLSNWLDRIDRDTNLYAAPLSNDVFAFGSNTSTSARFMMTVSVTRGRVISRSGLEQTKFV